MIAVRGYSDDCCASYESLREVWKGYSMAGSILRNKAKEYAIRILTLCRAMRKNGVEAVLIQQLLRAGTSVGAKRNMTEC